MKRINFKFGRFFALACCFLFMTGQVFAVTKVSKQRQEFITYSLGFIGVPYVYGADDYKVQGGFDCSGYVSYVTNHGIGVQLPRTAQQIYNSMDIVKVSEREPGDLVFFKNDPNSDRITHVGIYLGVYHGPEKKFEGKRVFISAVSDGPETGVVICLMEQKFWKEHYFATGRFLPATKDAK